MTKQITEKMLLLKVVGLLVVGLRTRQEQERTQEGHVLRRMTRAVPGQKREDLSTTGQASLHDPGPRTSYSDNAALSFAQTRVACLETPSQGNIDMT